MERRSSGKFSREQWAAGAVGALVLFALLYVFVTKLTGPAISYGFHHDVSYPGYGALVVGIILLSSILTGAALVLVAEIFIRQETYKTYLVCTAILTAAILAGGYWLVAHSWYLEQDVWRFVWSVYPNFYNTGFLLPGMAVHFAALHGLLKRRIKQSSLT